MAREIDKYTCPFCGQKSIFVGVHDDEGNYQGRPGCEYESDPWSGLCYALHHDGWGDCILCTDAHDLPLGGCLFDTAEEAFQAIPTLTPLNEPLTLDEMREMNGKAVWVVPANKFSEPGKWCVICTEGNDDYSWAFSPGVGYDSWKFKDYGDRWLAYRRPPEEGCEIKDYAETCEECKFCDTTLERPPEGEERHMTNADKIRAMSDEELAKLMANSCPCVYPDCNGYKDYSDDSCIKHLLEWLRQPADED